MTGDERPATVQGKGSRRSRWLVGIVVALVIVWTAGWFWLAGEVGRQMDVRLAALAARGQTIDCADRTIGGYPFRIEVRCGAVRFADRASGLEASAAGARAVALIYRPTHAIVELDGPGRVRLPSDETASGTWRLMQASLRFGSGRIERLSVAIDGFDGRSEAAGALPFGAKAERAELHLRPDPDRSGLDLALVVEAGALSLAGRPLGPQAVDIAADTEAMRLPGRVGGGPAGFLRAWAAEDGRLDIRSLRFATAGMAVEGKGALALETDGTLTGMVKLTATGLEKAGAAVAKGGGLGQELAMMASGFLLFGRPAGPDAKAGRSLDFTIEQGRMKLGTRPIGRLPPLFPAAPGS